jgi:hypothetical protein
MSALLAVLACVCVCHAPFGGGAAAAKGGGGGSAAAAAAALPFPTDPPARRGCI